MLGVVEMLQAGSMQSPMMWMAALDRALFRSMGVGLCECGFARINYWFIAFTRVRFNQAVGRPRCLCVVRCGDGCAGGEQEGRELFASLFAATVFMEVFTKTLTPNMGGLRRGLEGDLTLGLIEHFGCGYGLCGA